MNQFVDNMPDTSERTSSEQQIEALREQGGIFVEAVRITRMPMIVTDAKLPGNPILFANKAFIHLSGYSLTELLGQDPHFMNGEGTDPDAIERYQHAIQEGRDITLEILQYRKDGTPFQTMLFASPLSDGQGTVTNHFLSYLDITRRVSAEAELRVLASTLEQRVAERTRELNDANDTLTRLAAEREMLLVEVNHRAKNSLAVAASMLALQGRRQPDPAVKALFQEAHDRLQAMARVHDLLSKSESSQRVDLDRYVTDLCEALRPLAGDDARISLACETEAGMLVEADTAFSLGIVLTELITNAVKYAFPSPRPGTIITRARRVKDGRIQVMVRDDGIGLTSMREGSLGYGLIRSLVEQIKGDLNVQSQDGLSVTVTLPPVVQQPTDEGGSTGRTPDRTAPAPQANSQEDSFDLPPQHDGGGKV